MSWFIKNDVTGEYLTGVQPCIFGVKEKAISFIDLKNAFNVFKYFETDSGIIIFHPAVKKTLEV
ncbi:MAG: hypothetical protein P9L97_01435 [Candidatus Tenebribacter davisii]|nr:hypothetical protein [Candidatus Tenebribacter davisii]